MICKNCGKTIRDDARFCVYCGKLASSGKVCPKCGWTTEEDGVFCQQCGTLLKAQTMVNGAAVNHDARQPGNASQQPVQWKPEAAAKSNEAARDRPNSEAQLKSCKMFSLYKGEKKNGISLGIDDLNVFPDRLEYILRRQKAMGAAFGVMGMALSAAMKSSTITIWMKDIKSANLGRFKTIFTSLILHMKDGRAYTLVPGSPDSKEPEEILELIQALL